jgi:cytochrome c oxidase subunit 3
MADHTAVAHQFEDLEQQHEANLLGMWAFLATEVLFFGGLFTVYMVYRTAYPLVFAEASHHLDVVLGTINTWVLLTSSLTAALAVHYAQLQRRHEPARLLLLTLALGLVFLVIKGLEYYHKYEEHLIPGRSFQWPGAESGPAQLFFGLYFVMTGLHALHMVIGIGVAAVMAWLAWRGHYLADYMPVELFGLYWHFVDIVWIFLFPLLYLISR